MNEIQSTINKSNEEVFSPRLLLWGLSRLRGCFASPVAVGGGGFVYYSLFGSPSLPSLITNEQRPFLNATWWRWNFPYITCKCDTSSKGYPFSCFLHLSIVSE